MISPSTPTALEREARLERDLAEAITAYQEADWAYKPVRERRRQAGQRVADVHNALLQARHPAAAARLAPELAARVHEADQILAIAIAELEDAEAAAYGKSQPRRPATVRSGRVSYEVPAQTLKAIEGDDPKRLGGHLIERLVAARDAVRLARVERGRVRRSLTTTIPRLERLQADIRVRIEEPPTPGAGLFAAIRERVRSSAA